jgi:hypothetical protein
MTERYELYDKHGRITGDVLQETPHHATYFRAGSQLPHPDSPLAVTVGLAFGATTLVVTLVFLWIMVMAT